jgi:hypothetical protein
MDQVGRKARRDWPRNIDIQRGNITSERRWKVTIAPILKTRQPYLAQCEEVLKEVLLNATLPSPVLVSATSVGRTNEVIH